MALSMVISGGTVFDGSGAPGVAADVLVDGDRVAGVGSAPAEHGGMVIDATGLAVVPGLINILSHAWPAMRVDGSAESELRQGVTTQVFGEGESPGPADEQFAVQLQNLYETSEPARFRRLSDGLDALERTGVSPNVASFVGGANLRHIGGGFENRPLTGTEMDRVRGVLREEMLEGALGAATALIYPPGCYADEAELAKLCEVVAEFDGLYISHLRSEGDRLLDGLDELIRLGERTGVRTEVYHLKAAGRRNWPKMRTAIERIERARAAGLAVGANMYPYDAGGNPLQACIPPRYYEGGADELVGRLADPHQRKTIAAELRQESEDFENLFVAAGGGSGVRLLRDLRDGTPARGRWLADVAADLGMDDADALLEIVARDPWMPAAFVLADPANLELGLGRPWISIGSDAAAHPAAPPWSDAAVHPRTYGTFARVLGHYCRERGLFPFSEAVRRMTSLPADTLRLAGRGRLEPGSYADIAILDPAAVVDTATWEDQHSYALGVRDVIVNGVVAMSGGRVATARPGRRLRRSGA